MSHKSGTFILFAVALALALAAIVTTVDVGTVDEKGAMYLKLDIPEFALHAALVIGGVWIGSHYKQLAAKLAAAKSSGAAK